MRSLPHPEVLFLQPRSSMFLLLAFLGFSVLQQASGLSCVQCVSVAKPECLHGDLPHTPCRNKDADSKYCLKSVGTQVSGPGHFVSRGCSNTLETNCTRTVMHGDMYTICHSSCIEDGCNQASPLILKSTKSLVLNTGVIPAVLLARTVIFRH